MSFTSLQYFSLIFLIWGIDLSINYEVIGKDIPLVCTLYPDPLSFHNKKNSSPVYKINLLGFVASLGINALIDIKTLNTGVHWGCVNPGEIALTFDDGPAENTQELLNVLRKYAVKATFFINGIWKNFEGPVTQKKLRRILREGHQIGSHTWSHLDLTAGLSAQEIRKEMKDLEDKVQEILGFKMNIMRPPYGSFNETVRAILHDELGYSIIIWNLSTEDWANGKDVDKSMEAYYRAMEGASSSNSSFIALHHDPVPASPILAQRAIEYILLKGYSPVLVAKCIGEISL